MQIITWPAFSPTIPPVLANRLRFRRERWLRTQAAVYLMAVTGWATVSELVETLALCEGVSPKNGALHSLFREYLPEDDITYYQVLPFFQAGLAVTRLGPLGREMCFHLGWRVKEADWLRLQLYHEGDTQLEHTAMILAFCREARTRRYKAIVLPAPPPGRPTNAVPDVFVVRSKGFGRDRAFVEVERGRNKVSKWFNQVRLQKFAAVCTLTPESRARLVREIRDLGQWLFATDLETLGQRRRSGEPGPLWVEKWHPFGGVCDPRGEAVEYD